MDQARLLYLFQRYVDDTCSDAEKQELMQTLAQPASDEALQALMDKLWEELPENGKLSAEKTERILERILPASHPHFAQPLQKQRTLFSPWMKVAAAVALALLAGAVWYGNTSLKIESQPIAQASQPSASEHQYLKLPDGSTVMQLAESIGRGQAKAAVAGKVDGKVVDLSFPLRGAHTVSILTDRDPEALLVLRHSTAHVMAEAIQRFWPQALLA